MTALRPSAFSVLATSGMLSTAQPTPDDAYQFRSQGLESVAEMTVVTESSNWPVGGYS